MGRTHKAVRITVYTVLICMCVLFLLMAGWPRERRPLPDLYSASAPEVEVTQLPPMPVNWLLNAGDASQLDELPGIGPTYAARIIENREADGPFYFPEDVMQVKGIGEKRFQQILQWLHENQGMAYCEPQ